MAVVLLGGLSRPPSAGAGSQRWAHPTSAIATIASQNTVQYKKLPLPAHVCQCGRLAIGVLNLMHSVVLSIALCRFVCTAVSVYGPNYGVGIFMAQPGQTRIHSLMVRAAVGHLELWKAIKSCADYLPPPRTGSGPTNTKPITHAFHTVCGKRHGMPHAHPEAEPTRIAHEPHDVPSSARRACA